MSYPPEHHFLRDLRIETVQLSEGTGRCAAPLTDHLRGRDGSAGLGAIVTIVDIAGSAGAVRAVSPGWSATLDLSVTMFAPLIVGPIVADATLLRAGKKVVVLGVDVFDGNGGEDSSAMRKVGRATVAFSRLPASASVIQHDRRRQFGPRGSMARPDSALTAPVLEQVGIRRIEGPVGTVELPKTEYVRNSLGTINGGIHGMIYQAAAESIVDDLTPCDIQIHYLAQAQVGPARTHVVMASRRGDHAVCEIHAVDVGDESRLISLATVVCTG